jgi:HEAT repeat protein
MKLICIFVLLFSSLYTETTSKVEIPGQPKPILEVVSVYSAEVIEKRQIPYLMQQGEVELAIETYQRYRAEKKAHDFEVLQQIGTILLEEGARSQNPEVQLLTMYGAVLASYTSSFDVLAAGLESKEPMTQMISLQYLGRIQDDRCDELLIKAMASDYLPIRMQAGYQLAARKHKAAAGQIEALMYKLPRQLWAYFPQFFALIGTSEAIAILRHLIDDPDINVRIESILFAASYGRDDLVKKIRSHLTHSNPAEQEACAFALGILKDSKSIGKLEKLSRSSNDNVRLAAYRSLYRLGKREVKDKVIEMAKGLDPFAISALGEMEGSDPFLLELLGSKQQQIRLNAALSLLKLKNPSSLSVLEEFLLKDSRDLGVQPHFSLGKSQYIWKVIPSLAQHAKNSPFDLQGVTLSLKELILKESVDLPEEHFISLAKKVVNRRQHDLIPLLTALLENHQTKEAIGFLAATAENGRDPLARAYCNLALFRLGKEGPYKENVKHWIADQKNCKLIEFRPSAPKEIQFTGSHQELTVEETSRLLIDSYLALTEKDDEECIDALLEMMKSGNVKNRYALAGILISSIQ